MKNRLEQERMERRNAHCERLLRPDCGAVGRIFESHQGLLVNFGSNDYLGLATHPELRETAYEAAKRWGMGSGGSRLLGGDHQLFHQFEEWFAQEKRRERALLFNSGFSANQAIAVALASSHTTFLIDRLAHASIIDGVRLSGAPFHRFRHNDLTHLEELLSRTEGEKIVWTESLFSMDGDRAPLVEISRIAKRYSALLVVDEAHADGLFGERGGGVIEELSLQGEVDLALSTFGKAYGSFGAAVAGSELLIDALIQKGRSFIYTTALPPPAVAAAWRAMQIAQEEPWRRKRALELAERFRSAMATAGGSTLQSASQIVPVVIGDSGSALDAARALQNAGVWAPAVREPTVPAGTARLRINFTASHTDEDYQQLLNAVLKLPPFSAGGER